MSGFVQPPRRTSRSDDGPRKIGGAAYRALDSTVLAEALDAAKAGVTIGDLAAICGVHRATMHRWLADGREESEARVAGVEPDPGRDLVVDLYDGTRRAQARLATRMSLRMVQAAENGDWRAAEAVLRRWPAYRSDSGESGQTIDDAVDVAETALTAAQAREVVAALRRFGDLLLDAVETSDVDTARGSIGDLARQALTAAA